MKARKFALTQIHQRIDERLRLETRKRLPDWVEILHLEHMRLRAKNALLRLALRPEPASGR